MDRLLPFEDFMKFFEETNPFEGINSSDNFELDLSNPESVQAFIQNFSEANIKNSLQFSTAMLRAYHEWLQTQT